MKARLIRKVPYRLPGSKRLVWAIVLAENEGLGLLFVRSQDDKTSHQLAIGAETAERVFESLNTNNFPLESDQLMGIGSALHALSSDMTADDFLKWLKSEGLDG